MNHFEFHEGNYHAGHHVPFEISLFHHPDHLKLQSGVNLWKFFVADSRDSTVVALVYFFGEGYVARSPLAAPFGSYVFSKNIPSDVLYNFIRFVEDQLRQKGVKQIYIKNSPEIYDPGCIQLLQTFFINLGYVAFAEPGSVILVDDKAFAQKLDEWEERKLKQAGSAGLSFREPGLEQLEAVYNFILRCRKEKGYNLSMTKEDLIKTAKTFPEHFHLFEVFAENQCAASCIAVRAKYNVLYTFYFDHDAEFDSLSPVVMLLEGIYNFCRQSEITLLDLGTSAIDGKTNFSLLDFKRRLGAQTTSKFMFTKEL